jgi:hypothetical protein
MRTVRAAPFPVVLMVTGPGGPACGTAWTLCPDAGWGVVAVRRDRRHTISAPMTAAMIPRTGRSTHPPDPPDLGDGLLDGGVGDWPGDEAGDEAGDEPGDEAGDEPGDEAGDEPGDEPGDELNPRIPNCPGAVAEAAAAAVLGVLLL